MIQQLFGRTLKGLESKPSKGLSLMLISLTSLPTSDPDAEFWGDLDDFLVEFKARYEAELFELSLADRAILAKMSEHAEVGMISDIKVSGLRLTQQHFPEHFGMVD